jgi:hypothetical protein
MKYSFYFCDMFVSAEDHFRVFLQAKLIRTVLDLNNTEHTSEGLVIITINNDGQVFTSSSNRSNEFESIH